MILIKNMERMNREFFRPTIKNKQEIQKKMENVNRAVYEKRKELKAQLKKKEEEHHRQKIQNEEKRLKNATQSHIVKHFSSAKKKDKRNSVLTFERSKSITEEKFGNML